MNPVRFNLQEVTKYFTGQKSILSQVDKIFKTQSNQSKLIVLFGPAGIGKTQLCKKIAQKVCQSPTASCTWFQGEDGSNLEKSLYALAEHLKISTFSDSSFQKRRTLSQITRDLLIIIQKINSFWVVIIDNVQEVYPQLDTFLEMLRKNLYIVIIINTRNFDTFAQKNAHGILLESWTADEVLEFFMRSLNLDRVEVTGQASRIVELGKKLQNNPLAINQAVEYINHQKSLLTSGEEYGVKNYLDELNTQSAILKEIIKLNINFESLKTKDEIVLVLSVWRRSFPKSFKKCSKEAISHVLFRLCELNMFPELELIMDVKKKELIGIFGTRNLLFLSLQSLLAESLAEKGELKKSLEMYKQIFEQREEILGKGNSLTIETEFKIGNLLFCLKEYEEGTSRVRNVIELLKNKFGEDNVDVIEKKFVLGKFLTEEGKFDEGLPLLTDVLKWRERVLGPRSSLCLETKQYVTKCIFKQHNLSTAMQMLSWVADAQKRIGSKKN